MTNGERKALTETIKGKLATDNRWLFRGIVAIYECQTKDEQATETTSHRNGIGFNGCDAEFGSSLAKQILSGRNLSTRQIEAARRMMSKYAGQLARIAEEKEAKHEQEERAAIQSAA